jgi:hypothetical protein
MRHVPLAGLALAVFLSGCDTGSPLSLDPVTETLFGPHAAHQAVPLRGACELAIQPPEFIGPGVIRQLDVGHCQLTHLGRTRLVSDKVINFTTGTQTTEVTLTAANGDLLHASGAGTNQMIAPGRVAFRVELDFTGGTGRFAGASGEAVSEGEADVVNAVARLTMSGSITY